MKLLIGADPELFVTHKVERSSIYPGQEDILPEERAVNKRKVSEFFPAHNLIPGTKKNPHPVKGGAVQVDGLALEFNIKPAETSDEFVHSIQDVMKQLRDMVPKQYTFSKVVTATFTEDVWRKLPEEALRLGCDPDFNAYTQKQNTPPTVSSYSMQRMVGGHIHLGWTENQDVTDYSHFLPCVQLARQLDYFLGIPAVCLDKDKIRPRYYGQPGNFRPKPYGMEYRTLSNFWINKPELIEFVFNQTKKAFDLLVDDDVDMYVRRRHVARDTCAYRASYEECRRLAIREMARTPEILEGVELEKFPALARQY